MCMCVCQCVCVSVCECVCRGRAWACASSGEMPTKALNLSSELIKVLEQMVQTWSGHNETVSGGTSRTWQDSWEGRVCEVTNIQAAPRDWRFTPAKRAELQQRENWKVHQLLFTSSERVRGESCSTAAAFVPPARPQSLYLGRWFLVNTKSSAPVRQSRILSPNSNQHTLTDTPPGKSYSCEINSGGICQSRRLSGTQQTKKAPSLGGTARPQKRCPTALWRPVWGRGRGRRSRPLPARKRWSSGTSGCTWWRGKWAAAGGASWHSWPGQRALLWKMPSGWEKSLPFCFSETQCKRNFVVFWLSFSLFCKVIIQRKVWTLIKGPYEVGFTVGQSGRFMQSRELICVLK